MSGEGAGEGDTREVCEVLAGPCYDGARPSAAMCSFRRSMFARGCRGWSGTLRSLCRVSRLGRAHIHWYQAQRTYLVIKLGDADQDSFFQSDQLLINAGGISRKTARAWSVGG